MAEEEKKEEIQEETEEEKLSCEKTPIEEATPTEEESLQEEENSEEETEEPSLEEQLKEAEEKFIRVHADFENIKKRMEREKAMAIDFANENFAKDLLGTLDTLDMALKTEDENAFEKLKEGVELTRDNLIKTFEKHGIVEIETDNGFDPNLHEAVMQVDSDDHETNQIVQVLQKGYSCKSRVIRPTMVSICKG